MDIKYWFDSLNKAEKYFIYFIGIISVLLVGLMLLDSNAKEEVLSLEEQYNVNTAIGEQLVQCDDGGYDVYRPQKVQLDICGIPMSQLMNP